MKSAVCGKRKKKYVSDVPHPVYHRLLVSMESMDVHGLNNAGDSHTQMEQQLTGAHHPCLGTSFAECNWKRRSLDTLLIASITGGNNEVTSLDHRCYVHHDSVHVPRITGCQWQRQATGNPVSRTVRDL